MIVHADDTGLHAASCVTEYMNYNSLKKASDHPYPPDLAPSDFSLFGYVMHQLQGHEFTERAELVSVISEIVNQIPTDTLVNVLTTGREGYSDALTSLESMSNKGSFSLFMDFRESPTLAILQSGLNTLYMMPNEECGRLCCETNEHGDILDKLRKEIFE
jgi:hypothetical protein